MSTDDLLDEATRLADVAPVGSAAEQILATPRVLRALVERVREAERRANFEEMRAVSESIERDAAEGKLDKVRALVTNPPVFGDLAPARWYGYADMQRDVLAILDGKPGE